MISAKENGDKQLCNLCAEHSLIDAEKVKVVKYFYVRVENFQSLQILIK
jgi:hypothetical protein